MARTPSPRAVAFAVLLGIGPVHGCRADPTAQPRTHASADESEPGADPRDPSGESDPSDEPDSVAADPAQPYTPASTLGPALEIRTAKHSRAVYERPSFDAPLRGRIHRGENFHVYAIRDHADPSQTKKRCDRPWAQVAEGGWICLERTEPGRREPTGLPALGDGDLLPFIYARHVDHKQAKTPALPVYASIAAFNRGDAPVSTLPAYGSYAFVRSIANHGQRVLMTPSQQVVPAAQLRTFKPSGFVGEALEPETIPAGASLAWAIRWKTVVRAAPNPEAKELGRVLYHEPLFVTGPGVRGTDGETWFEIADLEPPLGPDGRASEAPRSGWISNHDLRRFLPEPPPTPILAGQITVDVDLREQVLSVWREDQPIYVTLISSGKPGDSTPIGLYRIETKWAYGKMANLSTADEPYYVDAVPWAMYFDGRYALHAAYWHDLFGHRLSHGCVNLAPRDAKWVFDTITPSLPPGWLLVHEHERDPGTLVRVRDGQRALPDRRVPLTERKPSEADEADEADAPG
jgi:hypothetical protein